jgi:hypothetical protein
MDMETRLAGIAVIVVINPVVMMVMVANLVVVVAVMDVSFLTLRV